MKFKLIIFLLLFSCTSEFSKKNKSSYSSSGFAYIYNEYDREKKIINKKFNNDELLIGHHFLRIGTLVKITNPDNKKFFITRVKKKVKYPEFYSILITEKLAKKIQINTDIPYVDIQELKKNKSFVIGKAQTHDEEKNVVTKAPIANVKITNISKNVEKIAKKDKVFSISVGDFYSQKSASLLRKKLLTELIDFEKRKLIVKKIAKNNYRLLSTPYKSVNMLKNDYIKLKKFGFEDLEIFIND